MDTDGLEFRHLVIDGRVGDLLLLPSAGAGRSRRPNQERGVIPARRVEEIREPGTAPGRWSCGKS
jgi:hypothetical protein